MRGVVNILYMVNRKCPLPVKILHMYGNQKRGGVGGWGERIHVRLPIKPPRKPRTVRAATQTDSGARPPTRACALLQPPPSLRRPGPAPRSRPVPEREPRRASQAARCARPPLRAHASSARARPRLPARPQRPHTTREHVGRGGAGSTPFRPQLPQHPRRGAQAARAQQRRPRVQKKCRARGGG